MRIINIITNHFINEKMKLENELERVLNDSSISTVDKTTSIIATLKELSSLDASLVTWQHYTNNNTEIQNTQ